MTNVNDQDRPLTGTPAEIRRPDVVIRMTRFHVYWFHNQLFLDYVQLIREHDRQSSSRRRTLAAIIRQIERDVPELNPQPLEKKDEPSPHNLVGGDTTGTRTV